VFVLNYTSQFYTKQGVSHGTGSARKLAVVFNEHACELTALSNAETEILPIFLKQKVFVLKSFEFFFKVKTIYCLISGN
jgi:hypothetical protein